VKLNKGTASHLEEFKTFTHETLASIKEVHQSIYDNKTSNDGKFTEIFNNFNVRVICLGEELGWKEQAQYAEGRG
jgi:TRAP-type mannitol/chloroaromatic compound transport system substrate-binding protein